MPTIELPGWFARTAVAEGVNADLLALVAGASDEPALENPKDFLADLAGRGILRPDSDDPAGSSFLLDHVLQTSMLEELGRLPGGVHQVREDLLRHGLTCAPPSLLGQLAIWASENADWPVLAQLWLRHPPPMWAKVGPTAIEAFAEVPAPARRAHPELTLAAAVTAGLNATSAGTYSDQTEGKLRQDGRLLHSGWAELRDVDSILRAGSLWMVGQRTIQGASDPLGDSWKTHAQLSALIEVWTREGHSPTSSAQTLFHEMSAQTALLRGDLHEARMECEQSMMLSESGDIAALASAGVAALALIITGNLRGFQRAVGWYEAHTPACGPFAAIAEPYFQLAQAIADLRLLKREASAEHLRRASALEQGSEFWSTYSWVNSLHDLTWRNPNYGLSKLEAAEASNPSIGEHESWSDAMATRARADLLCAAGRINQALSLLKVRGHSELSRLHLVSEARVHLCGQDGVAAVRVAESGIYDPAIHLPDRAQLFAIKSAALLFNGADNRVVGEALHAACTLASESESVLPFVLLPPDLRAGLLERHDQLRHSTPCILDDEDIRARLAEARQSFGSSVPLVRLTPREEILLPLLATPETAEEIARRLQVSVNTVRKQVVTLREKLAAPDRARLIAKAYQLGLLEGHDGEH